MKEKIFQKKYLIVVIAILALTSAILIANKFIYFNVAYAGELSDITNHWAQSDIEFMQAKGAISGYSDGTFKPDNNVTTGEAIKLIVANFDKTITNGIDHWASNYFKYAKEKGVVGYSQYKTSDLNNNITRKEVMYMVINSLEKLAYKPVINNSEMKIEFKDASVKVNENGIDYYSAIKKCYLLGIVIGDENNYINPNANITRAELVTILTRAYNEGRRQYVLDYKVDNVPNNKEIYGQVLNIMPNSFYEEYALYKNGYTPYDYANEKYYNFSEEALQAAKNKSDTALSALINVSYEMTDAEWDAWSDSMLEFCDISLDDIYGNDDYSENQKTRIQEYIEYVKENKIIIKGGVIMDPTTLGMIKDNKKQYNLAIKGMVNVEVLSNPNKVKILTYSDFVNQQTTIYNSQDCKYVILNILDEDTKNQLKYINFFLEDVTFVKEG